MVFSILSITFVFGQKDFSQNIDLKAKEVFKNCADYAGNEYLPVYKSWLERIEVKQLAYSSTENYTQLSSVSLRNKCNSELSYSDSSYDQVSFNPLKFLLDFETNSLLTYRIDNTDYLLIIHPLNQ